jgi:hypothetical protein
MQQGGAARTERSKQIACWIVMGGKIDRQKHICEMIVPRSLDLYSIYIHIIIMMLIARNCHFACEFLSVSFPTHDKLAGDLFTSLGARRSALLHFYSCSFLRRQSQQIVFMRFFWDRVRRCMLVSVRISAYTKHFMLTSHEHKSFACARCLRSEPLCARIWQNAHSCGAICAHT